MASSKATTVAAYLKGLPADRRKVVSAVRDVVLKNLPKGYREGMNWGHITYEVPLERYPDTYNGQPLCYVGLAAQKNQPPLARANPSSPSFARRKDPAETTASGTFFQQ